jgi:hypothetical protein
MLLQQRVAKYVTLKFMLLLFFWEDILPEHNYIFSSVGPT